MKFYNYALMGLCASSLFVLSSCVDKDYDLSDIDTTSRIVVNDLVVPMNLEYITLDQILDVDDDSELVKEEVPDGKGGTKLVYAIKKSGSFESDPIEVSSFTASKPNITPMSDELDLVDLRNAASYVPGGIAAYYDVKLNPTSFKSEANDFDKSIKKIERLGVDTKMNNIVKIEGMNAGLYSKLKIEGVKIKYPKGLVAVPDNGKYDINTGVLDLSGEQLVPDANGEINLCMNISAIDIEKAGSDVKIDYEKHNILIESALEVTEGRVNIYADENLPAKIKFSSSPEMEAIKVIKFTGNIEYDVDEFNIDPINITDVPDLINKSGTKLVLDNPQLYITLNNPMYKYGSYMQTGFKMTSQRDEDSKTIEIDNKTFTTPIPAKEVNEFVLSPKMPERIISGYTAPEHVKFSSLGRILITNEKADENNDKGGIPNIINVDAANPKMPEQKVVDFELDEELGTVIGNYDFYAPLQLTEESQIVYTDTVDGWNDEDVDCITIKKLVVNFDATTEVPFDIKITALPININGKVIEGVTSTWATVGVGAVKQPAEVIIEGNITHLDGIMVKAVMNQKGNETLAPQMKIWMDNFKAKINGYYEKEL